MQKFEKKTYKDIKKVCPNSELWIITNSYHNRGDVSPYASIYRITNTDMKNSDDLCSLLYGRLNSKGVFKSCKIVANSLANNFTNLFFDCFAISDLIEYMNKNSYNNLGIAIEYFICEKYGAKHCSIKQDKKMKQDIFYNGHYIQVKCSIATDSTKGSYSTTNDKI